MSITKDPKQIYQRLGITPQHLQAFYQQWQIKQLALFGSVLREDFHPDSDIAVLIDFAPDHHWGLEYIQMRQDLATLLNRPVDLLTVQTITHSPNPLRRQRILEEAEMLYVA
ncbi:MAG: nucleotidyltransferase family protein [Synechococcaceae cyanobacterium SM2_3_2]|nr:nucleotidyltransferase family protein [Synechococcaceae cyanobacterium SM2_3_2]